MESHERIGIVPVAAGGMARIDHHHLGTALNKQGIGEGHAGRARANDQIVGLYRVHVCPSSRMYTGILVWVTDLPLASRTAGGVTTTVMIAMVRRNVALARAKQLD